MKLCLKRLSFRKNILFYASSFRQNAYICFTKQTEKAKSRIMKKVALVLSSGGARGFAHIGAIEELEKYDFKITSIAGASMGALIGGMYAAGKLEEVKNWIFSLSVKQILSLADISISWNHLVKGDKVMDALRQIVPDVNIEDLPIPFTAIATDLRNHEEVVFDKGSLYEAIRASISIPSFFKPMSSSERILIDGGIINPLPLNRVKRTDGDILAAVNVSAPSNPKIDKIRNHADSLRKNDKSLTMLERMIPSLPSVDSNYVSLLMSTFALMMEQSTVHSLQLMPPDILVNIPMNRFGGFDYGRAEKITRYGKNKMREAIKNYVNHKTE